MPQARSGGELTHAECHSDNWSLMRPKDRKPIQLDCRISQKAKLSLLISKDLAMLDCHNSEESGS